MQYFVFRNIKYFEFYESCSMNVDSEEPKLEVKQYRVALLLDTTAGEELV
jgi:hypothetical protein